MLTRRAGVSPFPVDTKGERSEFREAESGRKSITHSMAEHGARRVGQHARAGERGPTRLETLEPNTHPSEEGHAQQPFPLDGKISNGLQIQLFTLFKPIIPNFLDTTHLTHYPNYPNLSCPVHPDSQQGACAPAQHPGCLYICTPICMSNFLNSWISAKSTPLLLQVRRSSAIKEPSWIVAARS